MKSFLLFIKTSLVIAAIFSATSLFATKHIITAQDFRFAPDSVPDVLPGDSIVWQWIDGAHTTTSSEIPSGAIPWNVEISQLNPTVVYVPTVPGIYRYYCQPHLSMGMVGVFIVKATEGVSNIQAPTISIYPNPFTDVLSFTYESKTRLDRIEVFDLTGKKVLDKSDGIRSGSETDVYLGDLKPGMYLLKFTDTANHSWARRIDKQR